MAYLGFSKGRGQTRGSGDGSPQRGPGRSLSGPDFFQRGGTWPKWPNGKYATGTRGSTIDGVSDTCDGVRSGMTYWQDLDTAEI